MKRITHLLVGGFAERNFNRSNIPLDLVRVGLSIRTGAVFGLLFVLSLGALSGDALADKNFYLQCASYAHAPHECADYKTISPGQTFDFFLTCTTEGAKSTSQLCVLGSGNKTHTFCGPVNKMDDETYTCTCKNTSVAVFPTVNYRITCSAPPS